MHLYILFSIGKNKPLPLDSIPLTTFKLTDLDSDHVGEQQQWRIHNETEDDRKRKRRQASKQLASYHLELDLILDHTFWQ